MSVVGPDNLPALVGELRAPLFEDASIHVRQSHLAVFDEVRQVRPGQVPVDRGLAIQQRQRPLHLRKAAVHDKVGLCELRTIVADGPAGQLLARDHAFHHGHIAVAHEGPFRDKVHRLVEVAGIPVGIADPQVCETAPRRVVGVIGAAARRGHAEGPVVVGGNDLASDSQVGGQGLDVGGVLVAAHIERQRRMLSEAQHGLLQLFAPGSQRDLAPSVKAKLQFLPHQDAVLIAEVVEPPGLEDVVGAVQAEEVQPREAGGAYQPVLALGREHQQIIRSHPARPFDEQRPSVHREEEAVRLIGVVQGVVFHRVIAAPEVRPAPQHSAGRIANLRRG